VIARGIGRAHRPLRAPLRAPRDESGEVLAEPLRGCARLREIESRSIRINDGCAKKNLGILRGFASPTLQRIAAMSNTSNNHAPKKQFLEVLNGLLWATGTTEDVFWAHFEKKGESADDSADTPKSRWSANTLYFLFREDKGVPKPDLLAALAAYFTARLAGVGRKLTVTATDFADPSAEVRRLLDEHGTVQNQTRPLAPVRTVYDSQYAALDALGTHLLTAKVKLAQKRVSLATFTLHTLTRPYLDNFVNGKWKAESVALYLGTGDTANQLKSARQAELIEDMQKELDRDFADAQTAKRLTVLRHSAAPTFQGYLIPEVAVCVGLLVWFPTFFETELTERTGELLNRMAEANVSRPRGKADSFTLNGHYMPHVQVFWDPKSDNEEFQILERTFRLFIDTHTEHNKPDAPQ
jgi:hypothetical protein